MSSDFGTVMQHGYIVEDVDKAAAEWAERVGAGPFYILESNVMDQYWYRGQRMTIDLKLAFGYWGPIQVELIQQRNDADSFYAAAARSSIGKLNHFATLVTDLDGLLARHNLEDRVVHSGKMPSGVKFVYLENYAPGGLHLELIEASQGALMGFSGMEAMARSWDGKRPLRPITALGEDLAALNSNMTS